MLPRMHRLRTRPKTLERAIKLRAAMTDAEKKLWRHLRAHQLDGYHFRKQVPVGPYIADFACLKAHLAIELDGGQHDEGAAKDAHRTRWLNGEGYRVIRFWNKDVLQDTEGVLAPIKQALTEAPHVQQPYPHPNPPPNRGRG
jgi:adenine-specific DNA-methyltransferase